MKAHPEFIEAVDGESIYWRYNPNTTLAQIEKWDRGKQFNFCLRQSGRCNHAVGKLHTRAITFSQAKELVEDWHNHLKPPAGWKFGFALEDDIGIVGVIIVGRPVARKLDDGSTMEITRCALIGKGIKNAASMMIGAACRTAQLQGYTRMISYTLEDEDGAAYRAAGFQVDHISKGHKWNCKSRARSDEQPTCDKKRWVKNL